MRYRVETALLELNLRAVRELVGKTQSEASKAERRDDHLLSTALGPHVSTSRKVSAR